ncbi:hypothetical protein SAMN05443633_101310 [Chryseobacterium arachidis]|uniref:Uncharacterized protein n=1 Tax=Chryseobacterium arachidis TaxID=1416778 RepID=A0A1M4TSG8_9FLAO|nr:hypothetical protein [Chryseobacterium arachidis]SHE47247.1 hypothetical protein SAMN05443633_101310 [Chryseobacterium arachidis]
MKLHQRKFTEIKILLKEKLGEKIRTEEKYGTEYLEIDGSKVWMSADDKELIVGYGFSHTHFTDDDNLYEGIIQFFDLLTNPVKITDYIKGNTIFKTVVEIEYLNAQPLNIGETGLLFYPYWKKTKTEISLILPILTKKDIEKEVNVIIN